ncbi:hypothetical protein Tco_0508461 [Tanacetum coccineum]
MSPLLRLKLLRNEKRSRWILSQSYLGHQKGVMRVEKRGKLKPLYTGHFKVLSRDSPKASRIELSQELCGIHDVFQVSNVKEVFSS